MPAWTIVLTATAPDKKEFDNAQIRQDLAIMQRRLAPYGATVRVRASAPDYGYMVKLTIDNELSTTAFVEAVGLFTEAQAAAGLPLFAITSYRCDPAKRGGDAMRSAPEEVFSRI
jgi:hypothetical protein